MPKTKKPGTLTRGIAPAAEQSGTTRSNVKALARAAVADQGEWVSMDIPSEATLPNIYIAAYETIGRQFSEVKVRRGVVYVKYNGLDS